MSLHNEIMNIPVSMVKAHTTGAVIGYKVGHKDARHDAAELSLKYEAALEEACSGLITLSRYDDKATEILNNIRQILEGK